LKAVFDEAEHIIIILAECGPPLADFSLTEHGAGG
jgi:hypothetical protein